MSKGNLYRLADSTVVEPLVNSWFAWSHTIAPVASSMHLLGYQLSIMQSYLNDPRAHVIACQNPKLSSGPFLNVSEDRVHEVKDLLANTMVAQRPNLEFAKSITEFHNYLVEQAKGLSLEPYYEQLPQTLAGYVELVYDYYNRPITRFIEGLLYETPYYNESLQSLRLFRQKDDNSRPFIMSTPRLLEKSQIDWAIPFADLQVDDLFRLDLVPQPLEHIKEILGLQSADDELLLPLLSQETITPYEAWTGTEARIRYLGHASVLIEYNGISILTDPYIATRPDYCDDDRLTYKDLPEKIDYVIITHNHHDHFCVESLLRLRHRIGVLVVPRSFGIFYGDLSLKLLAQKIGFKNVVELETLESISFPGGRITSIPFMGEHADLPHAKNGFVVRTGEKQALFAADSDCLDKRMYEHVRRTIGDIETVFLGLECVGAPLSWSCGPFFPVKPDYNCEQSRRYKGCDSQRALSLLEAVGAERIYIYAMGLEPWLEHLLGLAYDEDALQLKEARQLLIETRQRGFVEAKLLSGQCDIILPTEAGAAPLTQIEATPDDQCLDDVEDQFAFNS